MPKTNRTSTARSFSTVNNKGYTISENTAYTSTDEKTGQPQARDASKDSPGFAPWTLTLQEVLAELETSADAGLSDEIALKRHAEHGDNLLDQEGGVSIFGIFISQTANAMVVVLVVSMIISLAIKDWITGGVIGAVALINIVVGFFQELSAAKTMDSLRSLSSPTAHAIRGGSDETIPAKDLVPGDLINLKAGDTVPADCRLINGINFETEEALLTGESMPVAKVYDSTIELDSPVGDRVNMAFASSTVSKGRATAIVTAIGMSTEIGRIAQSLKGDNKKYRPVKRDEDGKARKRDYAAAGVLTFRDWVGSFLGLSVGTPLHRLMARLAVGLFGFAVLVAIIAMAAQKFKVTREVAVYAIVVAISMIPASMVVVLTITMAMGTKAMAQRHVMIRKLDSLEALGSVTDICSDKTGTLTQGKMIVRKAWIPDYGELNVQSDSDPFDPTAGSVTLDTKPIVAVEQGTVFADFMFTASLANVSNIVRVDNQWKVNGDPTEVAVQVFVTRLDFDRSNWCSPDHPKDLRFAHLAEYPFDSTIKRMSAVVKENETGHVNIFTKGAVERILPLCSSWNNNGLSDFAESDHKTVLDKVDALSSKGLRVLAFAQKTIEGSGADVDFATADRQSVEIGLTFMGLVGIYDPPRAESAPAVATAHKAGIEVHMLTGDHIGTATAIAKEVGILSPTYTPSQVMTAGEFDKMSDAEIDALPVVPLVIARCAPQTKVRMIEALRRRSAFSAMTGDGVNDSPSLRKADVGIAMGIAGSDVAKESSDIVLSDDNFASILNAVEEGRRMTANIQKFVLHLLAGNIAQVLYLLIGLAFKDSTSTSVFPMSPVEALWIIMATSSFPAMGLGFEEAEPGIMDKNPTDPKSAIFTWEVIVDMLVYGLMLAIVCTVSFASFIYGYYDGTSSLGDLCNENFSDVCKPVFRTRSLTFAQMTWGLLILSWEMIHMRRSLFALHPVSGIKGFFKSLYRNKILFWSVVLGFVSVFPVVYIPVINTDVFLHAPPKWEWAIAFAGLVVYVAFIELWKFCKRCYFREHVASSPV